MGYCSKIGIVLRKPDFEKLVCVTKESHGNCAYKMLKCADKIVDLDEKVAVYFGWIEWYEHLDEVKVIMDFLHEEADGYGFVEIGENTDDITTEYSECEDGTAFYGDIKVHREICIPVGEEISLP